MDDVEVETFYRSIDDNGYLICESSHLGEVLQMSRGQSFSIETMTRRVVVSRWKQMDPNEVTRYMHMWGI